MSGSPGKWRVKQVLTLRDSLCSLSSYSATLRLHPALIFLLPRVPSVYSMKKRALSYFLRVCFCSEKKVSVIFSRLKGWLWLCLTYY